MLHILFYLGADFCIFQSQVASPTEVMFDTGACIICECVNIHTCSCRHKSTRRSSRVLTRRGTWSDLQMSRKRAAPSLLQLHLHTLITMCSSQFMRARALFCILHVYLAHSLALSSSLAHSWATSSRVFLSAACDCVEREYTCESKSAFITQQYLLMNFNCKVFSAQEDLQIWHSNARDIESLSRDLCIQLPCDDVIWN